MISLFQLQNITGPFDSSSIYKNISNDVYGDDLSF